MKYVRERLDSCQKATLLLTFLFDNLTLSPLNYRQQATGKATTAQGLAFRLPAKNSRSLVIDVTIQDR